MQVSSGEGVSGRLPCIMHKEYLNWGWGWVVSLVAQMVKNLPVLQETGVLSLGLEDHLEKGMATHSSILAWRIPWIEEPGRLQSIQFHRIGHNSSDSTSTTYLEMWLWASCFTFQSLHILEYQMWANNRTCFRGLIRNNRYGMQKNFLVLVITWILL